MITKIGIVSGKILEALEQSNGVLVFGDIHWVLKEPHDLVLMSLGWLLYEGCVHMIEDPLRIIYQDHDRKNAFSSEACMFDLLVDNNMPGASGLRIKAMPDHISVVAGKILTLLEGCGDVLDVQTIEWSLNEHKDSVLMALGYLIRGGYVQGGAGTDEISISRLPKETAGSDLEVYCHV